MQDASIPVQSSAYCTEKYGNEYVQSTMTCAANGRGVDGCEGDSGSPLTYVDADGVFTLWGLNSWSNTPCATAGFPGVYVRIANFLSWIDEISDVRPVGSLTS